MSDEELPPASNIRHVISGDAPTSVPPVLPKLDTIGIDADHEPLLAEAAVNQSGPSESDGRRYGLRRKAPGSRAIEDLKKCTGCDVNALVEPKTGNIMCANKTCTTQWVST